MTDPVYILTGSKGSGKTTALQQWCAGRKDVRGILTPVVNGKRVMLDIASRAQFSLEAGDDEQDVMEVGRYRFRKEAFDQAAALLSLQSHDEGWLVIDEVGPLELRGEGFAGVIREILNDPNAKSQLIIVVRDTLVDAVIKEFLIGEVVVVGVGGLPG